MGSLLVKLIYVAWYSLRKENCSIRKENLEFDRIDSMDTLMAIINSVYNQCSGMLSQKLTQFHKLNDRR